MVTHYCAFGNAPLMTLIKSGERSLVFRAVKANGIDPKKTPHMHSLQYSIPDADRFETTWTSKNMGQEHDAPATFRYTRVK